MSHGIQTDIVPHIKHSAFWCSDRDWPGADEVRSKLFIPESVRELECDWQIDATEEVTEISLRGWKTLDTEYIGVNKPEMRHIWANKWFRKDDPSVCVYLLNESQYNSVGEHDVAIVADTVENINLFVEDFRDMLANDFPIESPGVAHQWG